jgi:asparagine synthase (glutamine-hydrolysing)
MCGICGYVGGDVEPDVGAGRRMRELLAHVLETDEGSPAGWFGHRRLKVIDLSHASDQPLTLEDGSLTLTYNGEIYNFRELRRELEAKGHRMRSSGDTETLLHAYREWGESFVERLEGMFAFALWDRPRRKLLLGRDRTGKKPLFYASTPGRVTFASEIKALRMAPWLRLAPALERLPEFLAYGYVPQPQTLVAGVLQVPPGALVVVEDGSQPTVRRWWSAVPARLDRRDDPATLAELRRLLDAATGRRMISDVPLGAFLSGGIDSSLIVALMRRHAHGPVRTFSAGFPDDPSFDERPFARQIAHTLGTTHTEFAVRADALALVDRLLWFHDQPYADSSAIPTYLVSQLAREHVTVALSGDGGDEVFGGYDRFVAVKLAGLVPRSATKLALRGAGLLPRSQGYDSVRRRAERFLEKSSLPAKERYQSWISVFSDDLLAELLPEQPPVAVTRSMDELYARASHLPELDQILYANIASYLPDDLHVKIDRMSMANSLEVRSPLLDTAVIELAARIPAARKVGWRRPKPVLREAFGPMLPGWVWTRRKQGFGVPMGRWFRTELRAAFEDEVLAPGARTAELIDTPTIRAMWDEHQRGSAEHGSRFWPVLGLERWLRDYEREPEITAPEVRVAA